MLQRQLSKEFLKRKIGDQIAWMIKDKGLAPQDFVLFAFGGGGGCLCCDIADHVGISQIYVFTQSAVFSAFGSSMMDVLHIYEDPHKIILRSSSGQYLDSFDQYNRIIADLQEKSFRDMRGEGFRPEDVNFILELELKCKKNGESVLVEHPNLFLQDKRDVRGLCDRYMEKVPGDSEISIEVFRLKATCLTPHYKFESFPLSGDDSQKALKGKREAYWRGRFVEAKVYEHKLLESGNIVRGPAIIEAEDTTYVIPEGRKYTVDQYLNGIIEED